MMRVTVEVHPGGDASRKYTIATIDMANITDLADVSDYQVEMRAGDQPLKRVHVRGHSRSDGWSALVSRALATLGRVR